MAYFFLRKDFFMRRFIVCDFYHEDCSINIEAVCATFEEAFQAMLKDINEMLQNYAGTEDNAECNIYADSATMMVNAKVLCDWKIQFGEVTLTDSEKGEIFRQVNRENTKQDVLDWLDENSHTLTDAQLEELTALVEKNHDCNVAYNAMLEATAEEYLHRKI